MLQKVCPNIQIETPEEKIDFTPVELRFLCGDMKNDSWKYISVPQVKVHLKAFLETRGYRDLSFDEKDGVLTVQTGEIFFLKQIRYRNLPSEVDASGRWEGVHSRLTPALLDEVQEWTLAALYNHGYACAEAKVRGVSSSGEVVVDVEPGEIHQFGIIRESKIEGMKEGVIRRYDAFRAQDIFSRDWLDLTERRIKEDELLEGSPFVTICKKDDFHIEQNAIVGHPRIVKFGVGINTEEGPIGKASWRSSRMGELASSLEAKTFLSLRRQNLTLGSKIYYLSDVPRHFINPQISFERLDESYSDTLTSRIMLDFGYVYDDDVMQATFALGPEWRNIRETPEGKPTRNVTDVSYRIQTQVMSHDFEYYLHDPQEGYFANLLVELNNQSLLSLFDAYKFTLDWKYLWNIQRLGKPLWVFALRGRLAETMVSGLENPLSELPSELKTYLGGSTNLRGFGRNSLPDGNGALTAVYIGGEVRLSNVLPFRLDPFLFIDSGIIGKTQWELERPLYLAEGLGMRWQSPIGSFRVSFGRGDRIALKSDQNTPAEYEFYFSFGEEF